MAGARFRLNVLEAILILALCPVNGFVKNGAIKRRLSPIDDDIFSGDPCYGKVREINLVSGRLVYPINGGNYLSAANCGWHIRVNGSYVIHYKFYLIDVEPSNSANCNFDKISVYSGNSSSSPLIKSYCGFGGSTFPHNSNNNEIFIEFTSDHMFEGRGFILDWSSTSSNRARSAEQPKCGYSNNNRVVMGTEAMPHSYNWIVSIQQLFSSNRWGHICGGSIFSTRWILSAAHCYVRTNRKLDPSEIRVLSGKHNIERTEDNELIHYLNKIVVHERFGEEFLLNNDIALLRLKKSIKFSSYAASVCLPSADETVQNNEKAIIAGWGSTKPDGSGSSAVLNQIFVSLYDKEKCKHLFSSVNKSYSLTPGMMCVQPVEGQDTCKGDSGSPLQVLSNYRYTIYGLVSFGPKPCGTGYNYPRVLTNVAYYRTWIEKIVTTCDQKIDQN